MSEADDLAWSLDLLADHQPLHKRILIRAAEVLRKMDDLEKQLAEMDARVDQAYADGNAESDASLEADIEERDQIIRDLKAKLGALRA